MKATENYFCGTDRYFEQKIKEIMLHTDSPSAQGNAWEYQMMSVFKGTFGERSLSDWKHSPPISQMCPMLAGDVEIVGWKEPGLEQGTSYKHMTLEEFMDAHVNHNSTLNDNAVPPFFFPKPFQSGPDMVFYVKVNERLFPVFVQLKLRQTFFNTQWESALSTVSPDKIKDHAEAFRDHCPEKVFISMVVAYPASWIASLPPQPDLEIQVDGFQQVIVRVDDKNFADIFPKDHVEFINRLKCPGKHCMDDDEDSD
ncbi:hypothetical protein BGZ76_007166, partial [Entomortierella beljakovae]